MCCKGGTAVHANLAKPHYHDVHILLLFILFAQRVGSLEQQIWSLVHFTAQYNILLIKDKPAKFRAMPFNDSGTELLSTIATGI